MAYPAVMAKSLPHRESLCCCSLILFGLGSAHRCYSPLTPRPGVHDREGLFSGLLGVANSVASAEVKRLARNEVWAVGVHEDDAS